MKINIKYYLLVLMLLMMMPGTVWAHHVTEKTPDAIAAMEYRIKLEISPADVETRNKLAAILYKQGKLEEASDEYMKVVGKDPDNFDANEGIGMIMKELKRLKKLKVDEKKIGDSK